VYGTSSPVVEARSPCSCSGSGRRRASKLTWCTAVVFGHGESLQSFVVDDESNQSPPVEIPVATVTVVASGLA